MLFSTRRSSLLVLLAAFIAPLLAGCSSWNWTKTKHTVMPWTADNDPQTPTKVVAIWTDSVASPAGVRGLGARLMFYNKDPAKPVKVDGSLNVYAFDETGRKPDNTKPDRKYVFTAEELAKHYSKSEIGHSYSIWIPWDKVDNPATSISLIVRFIPKTGNSVVVSEQATHFLPGTKPGSDLAKNNAADAVRQVNHEEISRTQHDNASSRLNTTTINVPARSGLLRSSSMPYTPTPYAPYTAPTSPATNLPNAGSSGSATSASAAGVSAAGPHSTDLRSAAQMQMTQWSTRSVPSRSRVPGAPTVQPAPDYVPTQPRPGE